RIRSAVRRVRPPGHLSIRSMATAAPSSCRAAGLNPRRRNPIISVFTQTCGEDFMKCGILSVAGLAGLVVGTMLAAEGETIRGRKEAAVESGAPQSDGRPNSRPLPTQVWWADRPGDLIAYEGIVGRMSVFDSRTRRRDPTVRFLRMAPLSDWAVPAPNGAWS